MILTNYDMTDTLSSSNNASVSVRRTPPIGEKKEEHHEEVYETDDDERLGDADEEKGADSHADVIVSAEAYRWTISASPDLED